MNFVVPSCFVVCVPWWHHGLVSKRHKFEGAVLSRSLACTVSLCATVECWNKEFWVFHCDFTERCWNEGTGCHHYYIHSWSFMSRWCIQNSSFSESFIIKTLMFLCDHNHCIIASSSSWHCLQWASKDSTCWRMWVKKRPTWLVRPMKQAETYGTKFPVVDMNGWWLCRWIWILNRRVPSSTIWFHASHGWREDEQIRFGIYVLTISDFWNAGSCWVFEMF